jgi:hypothetical protein
MAGGALPDIDARLLTRITAARQDRGRHQAWMNDVLRFGMPTYRRVGEASTLGASSRAQDQDDLFDTTLQTVLEDFGTDMASTFTPRFEHWVKFEPDDELTEGQRRQVAGTIRQIEDTVFGEIERSNYYEAAQECFSVLGHRGHGRGALRHGAADPLHFQPIELADLLMERGADGSVVGRWREMYAGRPATQPALAEDLRCARRNASPPGGR